MKTIYPLGSPEVNAEVAEHLRLALKKSNGRLPRHDFWGAGEPDCPQDLKALNGELHDIRCKVCGDGWRQSGDICFGPVEPS